MSNRLGEYFRLERERRGLSLGQLARLAGYRNVGKGARRIQELERTGSAPMEVFRSVASALELADAPLAQLAKADYEDYLAGWEKWADEPVPVRLVLRVLPGCLFSRTLEARPEWTREDWEAHAGEIARGYGKKACLILSRRHKTWIEADGQTMLRQECGPGDPELPVMRLRGRGGRGFVFSLAESAPPER